MSKVLIVVYKDSSLPDFYVPIVGESSWKEHWLPLIFEHQLNLLEGIRISLTLTISDEELINIQHEFDVLRGVFESHPTLDPKLIALFIDRIEAIKSAITMIMQERDSILDAFMG